MSISMTYRNRKRKRLLFAVKELLCFGSPCRSTAPSVASKVFGIFELFERIIFFYGCNDAKIVGHGYVARPSLGLYRLQRVNHSFRSYIAGSKKLRSLMSLEPMDYPHPGGRLQHHAPLSWFLGHMVSGQLDNLSSWEGFERFTFLYDHPHTTLRKLSQREGMMNVKGTGRDASWRHMRICTSADAAKLFPIHFETRSFDSSFLRDLSHSRNRYIKKTCSAQSTLGVFWDTYLALEADLRQMMTGFEQHRQSQLAEREAFKAQANVSPYVMYAVERQWACRDKTYQFNLDGEIGGFTLRQLCGARDDTETANTDGMAR